MFEILSDKLGEILKRLAGKGRLTEKDLDEALREVRLALLEADVNFKVVRDFVARIREKALGTEVLQSLSPGQQVIKIVHEELIRILGGGQPRLVTASQSPSVALLVGMQGSGKTTTAVKLGVNLKRSGQRSLLVAADLRRPAAVAQLVTLGKQWEVPVYSEEKASSSAALCARAVQRARETASHWVLVDTSGRLHIDEALMAELAEVKKTTSPSEVLLVVDAMTGQEAVKVAEEFHSKVGVTGLILTKMDGDARGGAALSITSVTGLPIKFLGIGEKGDALETFHPDRLASRILGMGDVLTLVEKAEATLDKQRAQAFEKKLRTATFDLEDLLEQLREAQKMGPLNQLLEMVPGFSQLARRGTLAIDEKRLKRIEAIVLSMTPEERHDPDVLNGSRRRRIARGSGTTPQEINQLLNQFRQMQRLMKELGRGRRGDLLSLLR